VADQPILAGVARCVERTEMVASTSSLKLGKQIPVWVVALLLMMASPFRVLRPVLVAPGGWKVRREW
jgi:hypothetical protein